jgi:hypothetical protein
MTPPPDPRPPSQVGAAGVAALLVAAGAAVERAAANGFTPLLVASRQARARGLIPSS